MRDPQQQRCTALVVAGLGAHLFVIGLCRGQELPKGQPARHQVKVAYFVPRDRKPTGNHERKIAVVLSIVSELYRQDLLGKGYKTDGFDVEEEKGGAQLVRGHRDASYYNNAPRYDANEQWKRLVPEIRANVGNPQRQIILVFAETYDEGPAEHLWPGVMARGAYNNAEGGLAIFSAHILRDEFCTVNVAEQRKRFFDRTPVPGRKAWGKPMNSARGEFIEDGIGAVAHELGHAFGLPHDRREDSIDIMGNGFRNLRWNFDPKAERRVRFSEENARLLMSSRYLAKDLRVGDNQRPKVEVKEVSRREGRVTVSVSASDESGLRAVVLFDRRSGSVLAGRALSGLKQQFQQQLVPFDAKAGEIDVQVIVTDVGGNQARTEPQMP